MERWKLIDGFPGYSISDKGRVKNNKTGRILKQSLDSNGYPFVCLYDGKKHTKTIHRLVAEAFIPNQNIYPEVNHKDGNKQKCAASNLEWCQHRGNCEHAIRELKAKRGGKRKGVMCEETRVIYPTAKAAASAAHVSDTMVRKCLKGRSHTAGGFHWKYAV